MRQRNLKAQSSSTTQTGVSSDKHSTENRLEYLRLKETLKNLQTGPAPGVVLLKEDLRFYFKTSEDQNVASRSPHSRKVPQLVFMFSTCLRGFSKHMNHNDRYR